MRRGSFILLPFAIVIFFVLGSQASSEEMPLQDRIEAIGQVIEIRLRADQTQRQKALAKLSQVITSWNELDQPTDRQKAELNRWLSQSMSALMSSRVDWMPTPISFEPESIEPITENLTVAVSSQDEALYQEPVRQEPKQPEPDFSEETFTDFIKRKRDAASQNSSSAAKNTEKNVVTKSPEQIKPRTVAKPALGDFQEEAKPKQPIAKKEPARSKWSTHSASAPLDWTDPFKDDPAEPIKQDQVPTKRKSLRPVIDNTELTDDSAVGVNQSELSETIQNYNTAIQEVRLRLAKQDVMTVQELLQIANELNQLNEELGFIEMYYQGLSEIDQMMLPGIDSAELANQIVFRRVEEYLKSNQSENSEFVALRKIYQKLSPSN